MSTRLLASLCFTALAAMSCVMVVQAAPDELISARLANETLAVATAHNTLVPAVKGDTKVAVEAFVHAWAIADQKIAMAKDRQAKGEALTKAEQGWLTSQSKHNYADAFVLHMNNRVKFFERAHNWNGDNETARTYRYETLPGYQDGKYTNSYAVDELQSLAKDVNQVVSDAAAVVPHDAVWQDALSSKMLDIVTSHQGRITNDELRSYVNETIWYASKQAVKDMEADQPSLQETHHVDLWKAIQPTQ